LGEGASKEHYTLCACGASKNKPFCDGSHWQVGLPRTLARQAVEKIMSRDAATLSCPQAWWLFSWSRTTAAFGGALSPRQLPSISAADHAALLVALHAGVGDSR
jgi:hypothetical protein